MQLVPDFEKYRNIQSLEIPRAGTPIGRKFKTKKIKLTNSGKRAAGINMGSGLICSKLPENRRRIIINTSVDTSYNAQYGPDYGRYDTQRNRYNSLQRHRKNEAKVTSKQAVINNFAERRDYTSLNSSIDEIFSKEKQLNKITKPPANQLIIFDKEFEQKYTPQVLPYFKVSSDNMQ